MPSIEWKKPPENVWLKCMEVSAKEHQPFYRIFQEYVVQFCTNGLLYTAFVPEEFMDVENGRLAAQVVAEYGDDLLVDIPVETLTTGTRVRVGIWEKDHILQPRE